MSVIVVLLFVIVLTHPYEFPLSPCPHIFTYKYQNPAIVGNLKISMVNNQFPLTTRLHLCLRAALKTKYAGYLELTQPAEVVLYKIKILNEKFVNYTVRFPIPSPLPTIHKIVINNRTICEGLEVTGGVVTNIFLEHTFPTNEDVLKNEDQQVNIGLGSTKIFAFKGGDYDCGIIPLKGKFYDVGELDQWPWLAAILIQGNDGLEFQCSGTLITDQVILTVAHCGFHRKYGKLSAKDFIIYLGKHNLNKWPESNSLIRMVHQLILHPDFSADSLTDDIGLLILNEPIKINSYVRPICLWSGNDNLYDIIGRSAMLVGWGKTDTNGMFRMQPRSIQLPIVTQEECLRSLTDFMYVTSSRTFCAGSRNGTGPCNGDSGSGLMLTRNVSKIGIVWELRGIISLSLFDKYEQTCDLSQYLIFTDVAKYLDWILSNIDIYL